MGREMSCVATTSALTPPPTTPDRVRLAQPALSVSSLHRRPNCHASDYEFCDYRIREDRR